jgi:hypothetical protein
VQLRLTKRIRTSETPKNLDSRANFGGTCRILMVANDTAILTIFEVFVVCEPVFWKSVKDDLANPFGQRAAHANRGVTDPRHHPGRIL